MPENPDGMFQIIPVLVICGFAAVLGIIIFTIFKNIAAWNKNNQQPVTEVLATIVAKRTSTHGGGNTRAYNHYYPTFELESGERLELQVKGEEYGQQAEGDQGKLTYQGTRYLSYSRSV
ncbi:DUF2500 domain-containing protein [Metabacillus sp. FJAT-52054]|uniref:DUF2500 domain-containing protein n=1 Tax=Metabacillus sediminis TaxID=3117746 RepID=A0ABZ2NKJ5_9BACI